MTATNREWCLKFELSCELLLIRSRITAKRVVDEFSLLTLPFQALAYFAVHTFGIRMIYPGTVGLLQMVLGTNLHPFVLAV